MKRTALDLYLSTAIAAAVLAASATAWSCDKSKSASAASAKPAAAACAKASAAACTKTAAATEAKASGACTKSASAHCCAAAMAAAAQKDAPAAAGMRAYLDPESGTLTSTPPAGEFAAPEAAVEPEVLADPVQTVLPDGSIMMELNGHGQEYTVMHIDAQGNKVVECVQDPAQAIKAAAAPAPAPEKKDR